VSTPSPRLRFPWTAALTVLLAGSVSAAAPSSESLLPATTKGFLAIPDWEQLEASFNKTQFGRLAQDPIMKPFADDLKRQMQNRFGRLQQRIGLTLEDLEGVPGGEVSLGLIQPGGKEDEAAVALLVDVTGKLDRAQELLEKVDGNMRDQGATKSVRNVSGADVITYTLPKLRGEQTARNAVMILHENVLCASDNPGEAEAILRRLKGGAEGSLETVAAFHSVMERAGRSVTELAPEVRWFIEPFGFVEARRAADPAWTKKRGKDMLKILERQGFDAIQGIGGYVNFYVDGRYEVLHRTAVFAPPVPGAQDGEKYTLAARMLKLPNTQAGSLAPLPWIPREVAMHVSFNAKVEQAFNASESLVDDIVGQKGIFKDIIRSLREDPNGPQIDLREDLVEQLGTRCTVISDYQLPITTKSERMIVAVQATDTEVVAATVEKTMRTDPDARKRIFGDLVVWEIVEEPAEVAKVEVVQPLNPLDAADQEDSGEDKSKLPNSAVCVAQGHLIIATHYDFLAKVLGGEQRDSRDLLSGSLDFQLVEQELDKLSADPRCLRAFSRTDETYRGTYELIRAGHMPEAESMLGKLLNSLLGEGKKGEIRDQKIDGRNLPDFEAVRRYFGPAGLNMVSEENGWFILGTIFSKEVRVAEATPE